MPWVDSEARKVANLSTNHHNRNVDNVPSIDTLSQPSLSEREPRRRRVLVHEGGRRGFFRTSIVIHRQAMLGRCVLRASSRQRQ
jgi:hypothetical protein